MADLIRETKGDGFNGDTIDTFGLKNLNLIIIFVVYIFFFSPFL